MSNHLTTCAPPWACQLTLTSSLKGNISIFSHYVIVVSVVVNALLPCPCPPHKLHWKSRISVLLGKHILFGTYGAYNSVVEKWYAAGFFLGCSCEKWKKQKQIWHQTVAWGGGFQRYLSIWSSWDGLYPLTVCLTIVIGAYQCMFIYLHTLWKRNRGSLYLPLSLYSLQSFHCVLLKTYNLNLNPFVGHYRTTSCW